MMVILKKEVCQYTKISECCSLLYRISTLIKKKHLIFKSMDYDELLDLSSNLDSMLKDLFGCTFLLYKYAIPRSEGLNSISKWIFSFVEDCRILTFSLRAYAKEKDDEKNKILRNNAKLLCEDADNLIEFGKKYLFSLLN